MSKIQPSN